MMERDSLGNLPTLTVRDGYTVRSYREGDAADWCRLISAGIGGNYTEEAFRQSTAGDAGFDPEGLFFAEKDGQLFGTACAVYRDGVPADMGYVHMVAVDPMHQGNGLGRALTVAVLHRLRERGFKRAVLETDDWRLPAIRLYLSLGFKPVFRHESHEPRWREINEKLGIA